MHSQPVYYEEPYRRSLEAVVVAIDVEKHTVLLDRTICYPEGGGQSGDIGTIQGCPLLDTTKDDEHTIYHHVSNPTFSVGQRVLIELDWDHRYRFMQMHTGQHIASGLLFRNYGIGTVSVHQGSRILTIETDASDIPLSTCYALEDQVNEQIREAHPVHYEVHTRESAQSKGLRRTIKVEGDAIRLVVIEDVDTIACGGLHVANTREVECFHYQGQEKIRGHVRLIFTVAQTARNAIREVEQVAAKLGTLFSAPVETLVEAAEQTLAMEQQERGQLARANARIAYLLLEAKIKQAQIAGQTPVVSWDVEESVDLKDVAKAVEACGDLALCAVKQDTDKLLWMIALQGDIEQRIPFSHLRKTLLESFNGKGGGKGPVYQGVAVGEAQAFLDAFKEILA